MCHIKSRRASKNDQDDSDIETTTKRFRKSVLKTNNFT